MASSGGVRIVESDSRFRNELTGSRGMLLIANFKASWLVYYVISVTCLLIQLYFKEIKSLYRYLGILNIRIFFKTSGNHWSSCMSVDFDIFYKKMSFNYLA